MGHHKGVKARERHHDKQATKKFGEFLGDLKQIAKISYLSNPQKPNKKTSSPRSDFYEGGVSGSYESGSYIPQN